MKPLEVKIDAYCAALFECSDFSICENLFTLVYPQHKG